MHSKKPYGLIEKMEVKDIQIKRKVLQQKLMEVLI
jgi:hypothetical protein